MSDYLPVIVYALGTLSNFMIFLDARTTKNHGLTKLSGFAFAYFLARLLEWALP